MPNIYQYLIILKTNFMKKSLLFFASCLFIAQISVAQISTSIINATCSSKGSLRLSSPNDSIYSFTYNGTKSGSITGNYAELQAGIYAITATLSNGNVQTLNDVIIDHDNHIQMKNWYLSGSIPSTSVNWGATLNDPLMLNWDSITTDSLGCINQINLREKYIIGTIPNFNLPRLKTLNLVDNNLMGSVPNFNLPELQYLFLRDNQLSDTIPNFNLPNLIQLSIRNNQLSGTIPNFNLPNLETIRLENNLLTGTIPNFNLLPNLQYLYLSQNQLVGGIPNFSQIPNLKCLFLSKNQLVGCIPNFSQQLEYLYIDNNKLEGCIPNQLLNLTNGDFSQNPSLANTNTSNFLSTGSGACFSNCNDVTINIQRINNTLSVNSNNLKPKYLWSNGATTNTIDVNVVGVYSVTITDCQTCSKSASINITTINDISISNADCFTKGKIKIPNVVNYSYTGTQNGNGTGDTIRLDAGLYTITATLANNTSKVYTNVFIDHHDRERLEEWYYNNNLVNSSKINWGNSLKNPLMPDWYGITTDGNGCIIELNLENCEMSSNLNLVDFPKLNKLNLSINFISGKFPTINCPNLKVLDFKNNSINDTIPNFKLDSLEVINLQNNQFFGKIPILNLTNLKEFNVSFNRLSGKIPQLNTPKLEKYIAESSLLNGYLDSLVFPQLKEINFYNNNLIGKFPKIYTPNLEKLNLCNNKLEGTIPALVVPKLQELNLSSNNFKGCVPKSFKENSVLNYIYGNISSNPCLNVEWIDYWSYYEGACLNCDSIKVNIIQQGSTLLAETNVHNPQYLWSNGETTRNIDNVAAGTYTVTIIQEDGCQKTFTKSFNIQKINITYQIVNAECNKKGKVIFTNSNNPITHISYFSLRNSGQAIEDTLKLKSGIYSITVTFQNNSYSTIDSIYVDHTEHIFLKNWYLSGNIPSTSVNWGDFLDDPLMENWSGIGKYWDAECVNSIYLENKNISGKIPNFEFNKLSTIELGYNNLVDTIPNFEKTSLYDLRLNNNSLVGKIPSSFPTSLSLLYLNSNNLSGCIPQSFKTSYPNLNSTSGNIMNNPNLASQSWSSFWNSNIGACIPCQNITVNFSKGGYICNNTATLTANTNAAKPTFLWSTGSISKTISNVIEKQYLITITQIDGCIKNDSIVAKDNIILNSSTVDSTCTSPGKILLSSPNNVIQSYSFSGASSGSGLGSTINNLATGIYNITATLSNTCKVERNNIVINKNVVYSNPNLGNDTTIILGQAVILKSANAASYRWSTGATTQNITVSPTVTTTYSITVTSSTGCISVDEKIVNIIVLNNGLYFKDPIIKNNKLQVKLWLKPNISFSIGSNNLRFNYNNTAVNNPQIVSEAFPSPYFSSTTTTGSSPSLGFLSLNTVYNGNVNENIFPISTDGAALATVEFNIVNANLNAELSWRIGVNPKTTIVDDDKVTPLINFSAHNLSIPLKNVNIGKDTMLDCSISSLILKANLGTSFLWNTGETTQSITVSPSITTIYSVTATNISTSSDEIVISRNNCFPTFKAKVYLEKIDVNTGLLSDELRSLNNFPTIDPYSSSSFNSHFIHKNSILNQSIAPNLLTINDNNEIVDWMFLELRKGTVQSTDVIATKAVLLQKDGDLVDVNGNTVISFEQSPIDNYFLTLRHRNHLGIRTLNSYFLHNSPQFFDFTNGSILIEGFLGQKKLLPYLYTLYGGDSNSDGSVDAFDSNIWEVQNGADNDYFLNADFNSDGSVDAFDSIIWELNNGIYQELK